MENNCNNTFFIAVDTTITDDQSKAFKKWIEDITYKDNNIILPDGTKIDGKIWINNQLIFDKGSYTRFLINYFKDNV